MKNPPRATRLSSKFLTTCFCCCKLGGTGIGSSCFHWHDKHVSENVSHGGPLVAMHHDDNIDSASVNSSVAILASSVYLLSNEAVILQVRVVN